MKKLLLAFLLAAISHGAFFYFGKFLGYKDAISSTNNIGENTANVTISPNNSIKNAGNNVQAKPNFENVKNNQSENKFLCIKTDSSKEDKRYVQKQLVISDLSNQITKNLNSSSMQEKMSAIAFLSEYGTNESKTIIKNIALSDDDSDAKAMAITVSDWSNDIGSLTSILYRSWNNSNNINIKSAIISAADSININTNKAEFNNALFSQLSQETNPNILIRVFEYFKTNDTYYMEQSKYIIGSMSNLPPEVKVYLDP